MPPPSDWAQKLDINKCGTSIAYGTSVCSCDCATFGWAGHALLGFPSCFPIQQCPISSIGSELKSAKQGSEETLHSSLSQLDLYGASQRHVLRLLRISFLMPSSGFLCLTGSHNAIQATLQTNWHSRTEFHVWCSSWRRMGL